MNRFLGIFLQKDQRDAELLFRLRSYIVPGSKKGLRICNWIRKIRYSALMYRNNAYIGLTAQIGEGVSFPHGLYSIGISNAASIGNGCVIFHHVQITSNGLRDSKGFGAPVIGNNVYIGVGATVVGNVRIGDNVRIAANATVVRDVPDNATVVMPEAVILTHDQPRDNSFVENAVLNGGEGTEG